MFKLIKRSDKKAFYGVPQDSGNAVFTRMKNFTELSASKNPKEYSRQYVDENFVRTDVIGYSASYSFAFDDYIGDAVLSDIKDILDNELIGTEAQKEIVFVDFSTPVEGGYKAVKRTFSVIGNNEGNSSDAYTYGGSLRVIENMVKGVAVIATPADGSSENVETVTFTEGE